MANCNCRGSKPVKVKKPAPKKVAAKKPPAKKVKDIARSKHLSKINTAKATRAAKKGCRC